MENILRKIAEADGCEAGQILEAVLARYAVLYPEWDVGAISVYKSPDPREQLDHMIRMLESMKDLV